MQMNLHAAIVNNFLLNAILLNDFAITFHADGLDKVQAN